MVATPITEMTNEQLIRKMDALKEQATRASVYFAKTIVEAFNRQLWEEFDVKIAEFFANHGVSKEDPLPTVARREVIELTPSATVAEHMILTGASKATVSRDRALFGIADKAKADAIAAGKGNTEGSNGGQNADRTVAKRAFDLAATLDAMDAEKIADEIVKLGLPKVKTLATMLSAFVAATERDSEAA